MLDYEDYSPEDFAADPTFRKWVLNPDPEVTRFWDGWQQDHPEQSIRLHQARELLLAVQALYSDALTGDTIRRESLEIARLAGTRPIPASRRFQIWGVSSRKIAASVLMVASLTWVVTRWLPETPAAHTIIAARADSLIVKTNDTAGEMTILLADNSVAILGPGSSITYPRRFGLGDRQVRLSGEAFFDVARDPQRPFLVYANETVTRVLGTSFRVRAFTKENTVTVLVKTGRVSVYPEKTHQNGKMETDPERDGLVLMPNQQGVFIRDQHRLEKSAVANRALLTESVMSRELIFDDRPVTEVLRTMEKAYGIHIQCDTGLLARCSISAQFSDENLKQRLNAICEAIGATYEMVDGQVLIHSKGCS
ncbi:FecR family protein [Dyadobacter sandarakinus]|uniref:FecR domain-containing protein n=1 Tax=Dyadobacter sandarakinus TaxID=2747268 RepID=A0ABX7I2T8_9BACT|nr:FecR domain-containing protein [Dyadobacter sandarakinus]QRR00401.1 FecR domain-containing protein [Dyadobacter sandarakinus]